MAARWTSKPKVVVSNPTWIPVLELQKTFNVLRPLYTASIEAQTDSVMWKFGKFRHRPHHLNAFWNHEFFAEALGQGW
ncbi:hypothetical protein TNCV_2428471 [Trichonephila clavipes]|nr:hypothetical protein TNCV_2428471 [Trichonephila clavipes]